MSDASSCPPLDAALVRARGARDGAAADVLPAAALLALPERAVQFGTGALLRGLVDFFVDAANRRGAFNGRIVAIGSTGSGRDAVINEQNGLFTLCAQGIADGAPRREDRVIASVSRALSAAADWPAVLACARAPELSLVFSNTTEVGIVLDEADRYDADPPRSFPGKLTRFLHERATAFDFDQARGLVVIPCELIERNGQRLREIVLALAARWNLEPAFADWVERAVPFCDTLVDRIVTGTPANAADVSCERFGWRDGMLTDCELYRLLAIQGDDALRRRLGFADADPGVIVTPDITPYRERKVRLLNGAHTTLVAAALLAGCDTVREAVEHETLGRFLRRAMLDEIVPTVDVPDAEGFARSVLDRFANPAIRHALFDITLQGTMKMRVRVVPSIVRHAERAGEAPPALAFGVAAHLRFLRGDLHEARRAAGLSVPADDQGDAIRRRWDALAGDDDRHLAALARDVVADTTLWGDDLARVAGFADAVAAALVRIHRDGVLPALDALLASPAAAGHPTSTDDPR